MMTKREQQVEEIKAELSMNNLTKSRRKDLNGMLKHSVYLLHLQLRGNMK